MSNLVLSYLISIIIFLYKYYSFMGNSCTRGLQCCSIEEEIEPLHSVLINKEFEYDANRNLDPHFNLICEKVPTKELSNECLLPDINMISQSESKYIKFTVFNTLEVYRKLLYEISYEILFEKENDTLLGKWSRKGWDLESNYALIFHRNMLDVTHLDKVNLDVAKALIFDTKYSVKWDPHLKEATQIKVNDNSYITYKLFKSPVIFISERDRVDKRVEFDIHGRYFSFSTSHIDHSIYPPVEDVIRMTCHLSLMSFYLSETNGRRIIVFYSLDQFDTKMRLPDFIYTFTIPYQCKKWYAQLTKAFEAYNEGGYEGVLDLKINN